MSGIQEIEPDILAQQSAPGTFEPAEERRLHWLTRAIEGGILGAVLAAGPVAADAIDHTKVHEDYDGIEVTYGFVHGDLSQAQILGHNLYLNEHRSIAGEQLGISVQADKIPLPSDLSHLTRPNAFNVFVNLYNDPQKAAEGIGSALRHEYLQEVRKRELVAGGLGALFVGGLFVGGAFTEDARRRSKQEKNRNQITLFRLQTEVTELKQQLGIGDTDEQALAEPKTEKQRSERRGFQKMRRKIGALVLAAAVSVGGGVVVLHEFGGSETQPSAHYPIDAFGGTRLAGTFTDEAGVRNFIDSIAPAYQLQKARIQEQRDEYVATAAASLESQSGEMVGPRLGETAFLVGSDLHSNLAMISLSGKVVGLLNQKFGKDTVSFALFGGDNTYGQSIEKGSVDREADIAGGVPEATVNGNHESPVTDEQFKDAHIQLLDGKVVKIAGVPVLGIGDPNITYFMGATQQRGTTSEVDAGKSLYDKAKASGKMPVAAIHEGYAAGTALGLKDVSKASMSTWFEGRGSSTTPWEDGVRDLPFSLLVYGHWHRSIAPRTVYNRDGTWTEVMELNTMGGAIGDSSFSHFSTPLGPPGQTASFPIIFRNTDSGLITGYQMYTFNTDGQVEVGQRFEIGSPDGQPYASSQASTTKAKKSTGRSRESRALKPLRKVRGR